METFEETSEADRFEFSVSKVSGRAGAACARQMHWARSRRAVHSILHGLNVGDNNQTRALTCEDLRPFRSLFRCARADSQWEVVR